MQYKLILNTKSANAYYYSLIFILCPYTTSSELISKGFTYSNPSNSV